MNNLVSLQGYFNAELILTFGSVILILLAFGKKAARSGVAFATTLVVLGLAIAATLTGPEVQGQGVYLFENMLAYDAMSAFFKILILATGIMAAIFAQVSSDLKKITKVEFYAFLVALTLGLSVMSSANNLLMIYLGVEMASIVSYILTGFISFDERSEEAGLKYVFFGGMASGIMIFGMSLLYGMTGGLGLNDIAQALLNRGWANPAEAGLLYFTVLFVLVGFGYKMAIAPFHMWSPDVYEGAPISVTAFLSVASKAAGFALAVRFFMSGFAGASGLTIPGAEWQTLLAVLAAVTMTIGNLVALRQTNIKRFLAYSSVAHAGYMLMGLCVRSQAGIEGILFYFVVYFLMNLGAFLIAILVANQFGTENMEDYKGLARRNTFGFVVSACMGVFLLSLAGIPPFAGFIAKWYVFGAVIKAGPTFTWLAVIGVINSVISLYYYVRLLKFMTFDEPADATAVAAPRTLAGLMVGLATLTLVVGLLFGPVAEWVRASAVFLA